MIQKKNNHYYIEQEAYPSVTHILDCIAKPPLVKWAAKQAAEYLLGLPKEIFDTKHITVEETLKHVFAKKDSAADFGTKIHEMIHDYLTKGPASIDLSDETIKGYFDSFLLFYENTRIKRVVASNELCYSKKYGYAGTMDNIFELSSGKIWLVDYKTGNIYKEVGLQLIAYKEAIEEMMNLKIDEMVAVKLSQNGKPRIVPFNDDFESFLAVKKVYEWTIESLYF